MKLHAIILFSLLSTIGCTHVPREQRAQQVDIHAHIHYLAKGDQIEIVSMTSNLAYPEDFIFGFKKGFHECTNPADNVHVDYFEDYPGTFYIHSGMSFGGRVAQEVDDKKRADPSLKEVAGELEF